MLLLYTLFLSLVAASPAEPLVTGTPRLRQPSSLSLGLNKLIALPSNDSLVGRAYQCNNPSWGICPDGSGCAPMNAHCCTGVDYFCRSGTNCRKDGKGCCPSDDGVCPNNGECAPQGSKCCPTEYGGGYCNSNENCWGNEKCCPVGLVCSGGINTGGSGGGGGGGGGGQPQEESTSTTRWTETSTLHWTDLWTSEWTSTSTSTSAYTTTSAAPGEGPIIAYETGYVILAVDVVWVGNWTLLPNPCHSGGKSVKDQGSMTALFSSSITAVTISIDVAQWSTYEIWVDGTRTSYYGTSMTYYEDSGPCSITNVVELQGSSSDSRGRFSNLTIVLPHSSAGALAVNAIQIAKRSEILTMTPTRTGSYNDPTGAAGGNAAIGGGAAGGNNTFGGGAAGGNSTPSAARTSLAGATFLPPRASAVRHQASGFALLAVVSLALLF